MPKKAKPVTRNSFARVHRNVPGRPGTGTQPLSSDKFVYEVTKDPTTKQPTAPPPAIPIIPRGLRPRPPMVQASPQEMLFGDAPPIDPVDFSSAVRDLYTKPLGCAVGVSVGDAVYLNDTAFVDKTDATSLGTALLFGFVVAIPASGVCIVQVAGQNDSFSGLAPTTVYYLSDTPGQISTTPGTNSVTVGIAIDETTLLMVPGGVSGGGGSSGPWVSGTGPGSAVLANSDGTAGGSYAVAEGVSTGASGAYSHAEGYYSTATDLTSHCEGWRSASTGRASHAEGQECAAHGAYSHAEGLDTATNAIASHSEGKSTTAGGPYAHAEGYATTAGGPASHAEGADCKATHPSAHAEGLATHAYAGSAHAEGGFTLASGSYAHAEGYATTAGGPVSHAEGYHTTASGPSSHAEGEYTYAVGQYSHTEGRSTTASGPYSHAEGYSTTASGLGSHAEGKQTLAQSEYTHAEGYNTTASSYACHAEGGQTSAVAEYSHSEGYHTYAYGTRSHAEGGFTHATAYSSHAGGGYALASQFCQFARGTSNNNAGLGAAQFTFSVATARTGDATPTVMAMGSGLPNVVDNVFVLAANKVYDFDIRIVAGDPTNANGATFWRRCMIQNQVLIGSVQMIGTDIGTNAGAPPTGWDVAIAVGSVSGTPFLQITVTGQSDDTVGWTARIATTEVNAVAG